MFKSFVEVRKMFLDFFKFKNHVILKGSSLIPDNDNTLLFTNAGMNQFKNVFLGIKDFKYSNVATIQYCLRVGGKHNDLNNIGYTNRHNTFFEMMGNFSFNSYFKELAIIYAWELLTDKNWYAISKDNLFVTVHKNDKETYYIWSKIIGLSKSNIFLLGNNKVDFDINSSNFWRMSEFGPCGYSTEIFFTKDISSVNINSNFEIDCNSCLELWNLVFVEFNLNSNYKITNLSYKSVDTGMGLERICSVLQGVFCNFEIDIFKNIKNIISKFINVNINYSNRYIFNLISDHIRSIVFLLLEDILPSNEHRGYILRKLIRRTIYHIRLLNINDCILYKLFDHLYYVFNDSYIFYKKKFFFIKDVVYNEEKKFLKNLNYGLKILKSFISKIDKDKKKIKSKIVFLLYDTYGLPIDLIIDVCRYKNIKINLKKFNVLLNIQKKRSRKKNCFVLNDVFIMKSKTKFLGYSLNKCISKILYIIKDDLYINKIDVCTKNSIISIVLDKTVFFPQSGGQCGDIGFFYKNDSLCSKFVVQNTKLFNNCIIHVGYISYGVLNVGDIINIEYNINYRKQVSCNHSSTHLLKVVLEEVLNIKIIQKGSNIKNDIFSFDFFCNKNLDDNCILKINKLMNFYIWKNLSIKINYTKDSKENKKKKILKDIFRIVKFDNVSIEYCCGTHVNSTSEIGLFVLINSYSISSSIKRIEAVTYLSSLEYINKQFFIIKDISNILSINNNNIINRINHFLKKNKKNKNELNKIKFLYVNDFLNILNISIDNINVFNKVSFLVKQISFLNFLKNKSILFMILNNLKLKFKLNIILFFFVDNCNINYIFCIDKYILNKTNTFFLDSKFFIFYDKKKIILENKIFSVYWLSKENIESISLYNIDNLIIFIKKKLLVLED